MQADISELDRQTQQIREQAASAARQKQAPKEAFDAQLRAQMASSNSNIRNAAVRAGSSVSGASVLSTVVKSRGSSTTRASGKVSTSRGNRRRNKNKGGIGGTSSGLTATAPGAPNPTVVTSSGTAPSAGSSNTVDGTLGNSSSANSSSMQLLQATQQMQEMDQDFNLQYLQLQEGMQAENRQYSAVSNVMKTKQDTAKNSLSNLK